jgi:CBS domain-containing protein
MAQTIGDIMHRGVVTCRVDTTAEEIARIMLDEHVSALVVTDERLDACGVITKKDLIGCYGKQLSAITAEDIMSPGLFSVSTDTPVPEAVAEMLSHKVHQLVVVSQAPAHHRPVGIVTSHDIVALMVGQAGESVAKAAGN